MTPTKTRLCLLTAPLAACLLALGSLAMGSPATALAKSRNCPAHAGTLAVDTIGRIWHSGHSLYGCTTVYGHTPRARRLGPWAQGTKVAWDGVDAAWTVPKTVNGVRSDRAWAANADNGKRWLSGTRLIPNGAGFPFSDARVQRLLINDQGAAWITQGSQVVLALHDPSSDPTPVGTLPLPGPLTAVKQLLLVGSFPVSAATLAASAKLEELDGDGDECGGVNPYKLTVQPTAGGPRVGAIWEGSWESTNC